MLVPNKPPADLTLRARTEVSDNRKELEYKRETRFLSNNWLKSDLYDFPKMIQDNGIAIWINKNGKFSFRYAVDSEPEENISLAALSDLLNNATDLGEIIVSKDYDADVPCSSLKVVTTTCYDPAQNQEFSTDENNNIVRNLYKPSPSLNADYIRGQKLPVAIENFYYNLFSKSQIQVDCFIDQKALHFQTFISGQNILVLKGMDTEAIELLYKAILEPIYGKHNSVRVSDEELDTKFVAKTHDKLLVFIDKIPIETANRKAISKQLQTVIKEKAEYTLLIIATNEVEGLGIEKNPAGFHVLSADGDLSRSDYSGAGSYQNLSKQLHDSLEDYCNHLFYRKFELEKLDIAIDTPIKDLILAATVNRIDTFIIAIKTKDISYFESFNNSVNTDYYLEIRENFFKGVVSKAGLTDYFNALESENFSAKAFLAQLRAADKNFFSDKKNTKGVSTGDELYIIDSEYNEYFTIEAANNIVEVQELESTI